MTQSKSRRLLYQQARLIRIQWAVILALVCTIVLMAIFLPKAKAIEETATPTLELEPASYVTPEIMPEPTIETEPEEIEPVLEELGEFRLTAYCACRKCCGKDPGDFGYGVTASGAVVEAGRTIAVDSSVNIAQNVDNQAFYRSKVARAFPCGHSGLGYGRYFCY